MGNSNTMLMSTVLGVWHYELNQPLREMKWKPPSHTVANRNLSSTVPTRPSELCNGGQWLVVGVGIAMLKITTEWPINFHLLVINTLHSIYTIHPYIFTAQRKTQSDTEERKRRSLEHLVLGSFIVLRWQYLRGQSVTRIRGRGAHGHNVPISNI